jgi:16S rRNA (cytosine967-C5)-methyltransferase
VRLALPPGRGIGYKGRSRSTGKKRNVQGEQGKSKGRPVPAGLAARELAHRLIAGVLVNHRPLEDALAAASARPEVVAMEARDRAFARALAATVLRRLGEIEHVLARFLQQPLRKDALRVRPMLLAGAAQILCMEAAPHAAVDLAVAATRRVPSGARYTGLVNAVLRRVAAEGAAVLARLDGVELDMPAWMWQRWRATYGADTARRIARASLREAALDITVKPGEDAAAWAEKLHGTVLATGTVRLREHQGRIEELPGYGDGAWWVQDAAAALVARVAGDVAGRDVADLCAAPGGKTAMLAAQGAHVTAVDVSARRLERLAANLVRLRLTAEVVAADAATWSPARAYDVVVLDAPCTATGTIRRHPDILRLKAPADVARMAQVQRALLDNAARLVRPGGTLVYATCSLEPEEGEQQVAAFLAREPGFARRPIAASEIGADAAWVTGDGDLRTFPFHMPAHSPALPESLPESLSGMDGFYIARLRRHA